MRRAMRRSMRSVRRSVLSVRSVRSMRGEFIFCICGLSLRVQDGQCLAGMTKHAMMILVDRLSGLCVEFHCSFSHSEITRLVLGGF
jgi:hypothetical protein